MTNAMQSKITDIVSQLVRQYKPEKIILFGSTARGDSGPDSDIDLFLVKKGVDTVPYHQRISDASGVILHNAPIDVLVYTPWEVKKRMYLGDPFFKQIFAEGKVLYGA